MAIKKSATKVVNNIKKVVVDPTSVFLKPAKPTAKATPKATPKPTVKAVEKSAVTAKPKPSAVATTGKIKIGNVKVSTSGGPKPKTSVSGTSMISGTKVKNPTPKPKFTAPSVAQFRQSAAYRTNSMGYKEYVDTAYQVYQAKYKKK